LNDHHSKKLELLLADDVGKYLQEVELATVKNTLILTSWYRKSDGKNQENTNKFLIKLILNAHISLHRIIQFWKLITNIHTELHSLDFLTGTIKIEPTKWSNNQDTVLHKNSKMHKKSNKLPLFW